MIDLAAHGITGTSYSVFVSMGHWDPAFGLGCWTLMNTQAQRCDGTIGAKGTIVSWSGHTSGTATLSLSEFLPDGGYFRAEGLCN